MDEKKIVHANGIETAYIEEGTGTPLIFIHGYTSSKESYEEHIHKLSDKYRVICYDIVGHGHTNINGNPFDMDVMADQLHGFIEALGLEDVVVVGHSMGGLVVMGYQKKYKNQHLKATILADVPPMKPNTDDWKFGAVGITVEKVQENLRIMQNDFRAWAEPLLKFSAGDTLGTEEEFEQKYQEWVSHQKVDEIIALQAVTVNMDYRDVIPQWEGPCAYFYADPGSYANPLVAGWYKENFKVPFELVVFHCGTHNFPETMKDEYCQKIDQYIQSL